MSVYVFQSTCHVNNSSLNLILQESRFVLAALFPGLFSFFSTDSDSLLVDGFDPIPVDAVTDS